jgi:hypothetical protein
MANMLYKITSADIAVSMQQTQAVCLKAATHVWHLPDIDNGNGHVVKYMKYAEAVQHEQNAMLYRLVGLPTVASRALKNDHIVPAIAHVQDIKEVDGILAMPFIKAQPLSQYKKMLDSETRGDLFRWLKENTLAACVIACHTDPNDTNILCNEHDNELDVEFIDPEYALASTVEIPVAELYEELTNAHRRFPQYTITDYDHDALIENAEQIVEHLKEQSMLGAIEPEIVEFVPRMIERGEELITLLHKKKPAF